MQVIETQYCRGAKKGASVSGTKRRRSDPINPRKVEIPKTRKRRELENGLRGRIRKRYFRENQNQKKRKKFRLIIYE